MGSHASSTARPGGRYVRSNASQRFRSVRSLVGRALYTARTQESYRHDQAEGEGDAKANAEKSSGKRLMDMRRQRLRRGRARAAKAQRDPAESTSAQVFGRQFPQPLSLDDIAQRTTIRAAQTSARIPPITCRKVTIIARLYVPKRMRRAIEFRAHESC